MRILLVTGDQPIECELAQCLERSGHELTCLSARGDDLLSCVEHGERFHAAVLDQAALGQGWPRQIRELRRRAPYLPAVVLFAANEVNAWQRAILAGAYETLPIQSPLGAILEALSRALHYSAGKTLEALPHSADVIQTLPPSSPAGRTASELVEVARGPYPPQEHAPCTGTTGATLTPQRRDA